MEEMEEGDRFNAVLFFHLHLGQCWRMGGAICDGCGDRGF